MSTSTCCKRGRRSCGCGTTMRKLMEGKRDIPCVNCEGRVPLWDKLEELFASPEMQQRVRELQGAIGPGARQREQGARAGGRGDIHGGAGRADQPGVQRERPRH
ncbi:hypothetical protein SBA6_390003 [Candidatus Sulfopaludibacter sp. SbA6]|nr:hypothetical protein SBA6_390003 [Candidatus Sulfopaludibacter sp. SbA6]